MSAAYGLSPEPATLTPWQLARLGECSDPDALDSVGARWLAYVAEDAAEAVADQLDTLDAESGEVADLCHEIADRCVPTYTRDLWSTFVDLGAWDAADEMAADMGLSLSPGQRGGWSNVHGDGMASLAALGLYAIAERLAGALVADWLEAAADEDDGEEVAED